jgi:hypothetical protein
MSWNVNRVRALHVIVVAGLLFALFCAVLGSVGTTGHPGSLAHDSDAAKTPPHAPSAMTFQIVG